MKLADIMGHAGLASYAIVAMLIFFAVFLAVVWHTFSRAHAARWAHDARLPLDDADPLPLTRPGADR